MLDQAYKISILKPFKPVIDAADAFFFGTDRITDSSPHILDNIDIKRYMSVVIVALLPAALASLYFFGIKALSLIAVSYIFGGTVEVVFSVVRKKEINEGFLVTGLIFPLLLPPSTPLWIAAVGIVFGVFFGKEVFGGTGKNLFNPALVGRLFITIAFPSVMTSSWIHPLTDAVTSATPLTVFKTSGEITPGLSLLFGGQPGSMGETFRIGIVLGGIFLMYTSERSLKALVSSTRRVILSLGFIFLTEKANCLA